MKSKKIFRIELKSMEWFIAKDIAVLAAFSNGSDTKLTIEELATSAKVRNAEFSDQPFTISLIGKDLLIDKGTVNLLHLTEIEVMDLEMPQMTAQDARDILDELAPTLHRQTGIADINNHENLN